MNALDSAKKPNGKAFRFSELRYRRLFEAAKDGILILDAETGMIVDANPFLIELLGVTHEAFLGMKVWELGVFKHVVANKAKFAELQARKYVHYDNLPLETADGRQIAVEFVSNVYLENQQKVIQCSIRDISARKQSEDALRASQQLTEGILNAIPVRVFWKDKNLVYLGCNTIFARDAGFAEPKDIIGKDDYQMAWRDQAELHRVDDRKVIESGSPRLLIEEPQTTPDGKIISLLSSKIPLRCAKGEICGVLGTYTDITERKRGEEALRQSETRYRALFDNMVEGFSYCRVLFENGKPKDFVYLEVNKAFERLTGLKDVIGRKVSEVIPGIHESDPKLLERYSRVGLTGQPEQFEIYVAAMDRWFSISLYCPEKEHFVTVFNDITERKMAETRLHLQTSALEAAANAIVITGSKGVIEWANAAFTTFTGYRVAEVVGKTLRILKSGKQDERFYRDLWNTIWAGKVWHGELINRRKDGTDYMEEMTITPLKIGGDEITHFVAVKQDISERKKLEAHYLRVQRMDSIGTLAGGIAHDLNNVLAPILMAVEILRDKITDHAGREILATVEASAQHGAKLVKQVLGFARGIEGQRITVNPVHILNDIRKIIRDTFPKNIKFRIAPSRDLWTVTGDPTQLHQVFTNLCVNARDAMPDGGNLSVTLENTILDDVYAGMHPDSKPGAYVMVTVTDTGTGIAPRIVDRIFEPFFTTKEIGKGTGMGLSTTISIVKSHGGFVAVYSEMGKGSTFMVYLPADTTAKAVETTDSTQAELPHGNGELVLLVDDDEHIRDIAHRTLEQFGYRVLLASNGVEALAAYAEHRKEIAIVLTDMDMPVLDGAASVVALRAMNPQVKVVVSSGFTVSSGNAHAAGASFKHVLAKPYRAEAMLNILAKALREPA